MTNWMTKLMKKPLTQALSIWTRKNTRFGRCTLFQKWKKCKWGSDSVLNKIWLDFILKLFLKNIYLVKNTSFEKNYSDKIKWKLSKFQIKWAGLKCAEVKVTSLIKVELACSFKGYYFPNCMIIYHKVLLNLC